MQPSAPYGCGTVIGLQVPMWAAHVPAQAPQPTVIGNMMPYPTQPAMQYQPCFIPPLQPTNHGMYINNQVPSYSIVPQQYIPVPTNRGFRPHVGMAQPSTMPYMIPQDYMPVANSGFPQPLAGAPPIQPQTRPITYEIPPVQQTQFAPQYPKPTRHISAFVQSRPPAIINQQAYEHTETNLAPRNISCEGVETPKQPEKLEEQCEISAQSSSEEGTDELHKPNTDTVEMPSATCEHVPTPSPLPLPLPLIEDEETIDELPDIQHSPSETTLVPSPLSSDGMRTVCNSPFCPVLSDSDEEELTAGEDDQIPTKEISSSSEYTLAFSSVERLEPEHPYDNESTKPSTPELQLCKPKPVRKDDLNAHSVANIPPEICNSNTIRGNQSEQQQRSIRSLIDTPVYNTSHSRVLCQLSQLSGSSPRQCKAVKRRPLTTHFRQLFQPMPSSTKPEGKTN